MDTLCGIGLPELLILALLAFVLIGPERTREVAITLGRWLGRAMKSPWWREFTQVTTALRDLPTTLVRMAELEEAQAELRRTLREIEREGRVDEGALSGRTAPRPPQTSSTDPWGVASLSPADAPPPPQDSVSHDI